uniref:Uncharacterized protein n=1 Tax=Tolypothrix bouteillei VB521301 TaxID=1479485 RepID=A0A0C1RAV9_9CYAN
MGLRYLGFLLVRAGGESSPVGGFPAPWELVSPALQAGFPRPGDWRTREGEQGRANKGGTLFV